MLSATIASAPFQLTVLAALACWLGGSMLSRAGHTRYGVILMRLSYGFDVLILIFIARALVGHLEVGS